jgi:hypothetical protein
MKGEEIEKIRNNSYTCKIIRKVVGGGQTGCEAAVQA